MSESETDGFNFALGKLVADVVDEDSEKEIKEFEELLDKLSSLHERYSSEEYLAEGGMKEIYRVKDGSSLRSVAKAVLKSSHKDKEHFMSFIREARITALLEHPNIVPVYEISQKNGEPFFIMKELTGQGLDKILGKLKEGDSTYLEKYKLPVLLGIFIKVCDAIAYAHSRGVLHLDLKPDNIHVGEFGEVLVIDWGLAKNLNDNTEVQSSQFVTSEIDVSQTMNGWVKGTIGYMAPEQAQGKNDEKNKQTDIYALGAILYSILCYKAPYDNKDKDKALLKISLGQYTRLTGSHPSAVVAVVEKAMARDVEKRYETVLTLTADINRYLQGFATEAQDAKFTEHLKLFYKRHKLPVLLAASFVLILVVVTHIFINSLKEKERFARLSAEEARKSELAALESQKIATENEQMATKLYNDLKETTKAKDELTTISVPLALKKSSMLSNHLDFEGALQTLLEVYSDDIVVHDYWRRLGELYIGKLDFEKGQKYLEKSLEFQVEPFYRDKIQKLQRSVAGVTLVKGDLESFLSFIRKMTFINKYNEVLGHFFYEVYNNWGLSMDEKETLFRRAMTVLNPKGKLKYRLQKFGAIYHADFSNNYSLVNITPVTGFPITRLSLKNCENLKDMKWTRGAKLEYLNLSGTKSHDYRFLLQLEVDELVLSDIIIHSLQFRRVKIRKLDFTGATVNLADVSNTALEQLVLCSAKVSNLEQLENLPSLKAVVIPPKAKVSKALIERLREREVTIKRCNCNGAKTCKIASK
ncbi:MAG: serine/threonine protein kinase [Lentisphaeraceae bacterium]|nr:serine/threonine protein kinase [Lentisphaeraceae bacterium]